MTGIASPPAVSTDLAQGPLLTRTGGAPCRTSSPCTKGDTAGAYPGFVRDAWMAASRLRYKLW